MNFVKNKPVKPVIVNSALGSIEKRFTESTKPEANFKFSASPGARNGLVSGKRKIKLRKSLHFIIFVIV
jgi:hypothetical protein